jgi:hypothetical protein
MNNELERIWVPLARYCPGICLAGMRKTRISSVKETGVPEHTIGPSYLTYMFLSAV